MGGIFGGGSQSTNLPRAGALNIQSSAYGLTVPLVWGCQRIPVNLIWYGDFTSKKVTSSAGGKGGGGSVVTGYKYKCAVAMGICEGFSSLDIGDVWVNKNQYQFGAKPTKPLIINNESHTISGAGTLTVLQGTAWTSDISVKDNDGDSVVHTCPGAGVYSFSPALDGTRVYISYHYTPPAVNQTALDQINFELFHGTHTQAPWDYLVTKHPEQALNYPGIAYIACPSDNLGTSPSLGNYNVEVLGSLQYGGGVIDCNPADWLRDFLSNHEYGCVFPSAMVGDLSDFSNYCVSNNLFISPALNGQNAAADTISKIMDALNCVPVFSGGLLNVVPRGDSVSTAHGVTYTPNLAPVCSVGDDDFISSGDDPVTATRKQNADAYNQCQVEFLNRDNQYNVEIAEAKDLSNISLYGLRPDTSSSPCHFFCTASTAQQSAQLQLQRKLYVRNQYQFVLGWDFILIEPMDIISVTDAGLGLADTPLRVLKIEENGDGDLTFTCEEMPLGVASAGAYNTQSPGGFAANYNTDPGDTDIPVLFVGPYQLTNNALEVWAAFSGGDDWGGCEVWVSNDGQTYAYAGIQHGVARYGSLSAGVGSLTTDTLSVLLTDTTQQILSGTPSDAANLATLCYADGEMLAYEVATLTGPGAYDLTGLVRGAYGTTAAAHLSGTDFARVDDQIFKYRVPHNFIGKEIYVKLLSFNAYGFAGQSLDEVNAITFTLTDPASGEIINVSIDGGTA